MSDLKVCANCGKSVSEEDKYCPNCGQELKTRQVSLRDFILDFLGDFFTFDSKFFKSLVPLLFRPGKMSREYVEGKRVRYIPPLRFFLFTSIIFFFVLSNVPQLREYDFGQSVSFKEDLSETDSATILEIDSAFSFQEKILSYPASMTEQEVIEEIQPELEGFEKMILIQMAKLLRDQDNQFANFLISNGTVVLIGLLLIFSLVLKLFYIRKHILFLTHLVFSLHFHTFLLILSILIALMAIMQDALGGGFNEWVVAGVLGVSLVYMFLAIRNFYQQKRLFTILKFIFISSLYFIVVLPLSLIVTFIVGFFLF